MNNFYVHAKGEDLNTWNERRGEFIKIVLGILPESVSIRQAAIIANKLADVVIGSKPTTMADMSIKNDRKDNKLRWELLPLDVIEEAVRVFTYGAQKYAPNTWMNLPDGYERYKAALLRHLTLIDQGKHFDEESGLLHASQVLWNAIALCYFEMKEQGKGSIKTEE